MSSKRKITVDMPSSGSSSNSNRKSRGRSGGSGGADREGDAKSTTVPRASVFSRLGTKGPSGSQIKSSNSGAASGLGTGSNSTPIGGTVCRPWAENGHCPYGHNCKFSASHVNENAPAATSGSGSKRRSGSTHRDSRDRRHRDRSAKDGSGEKKKAKKSASRPGSSGSSNPLVAARGSPLIDMDWENWDEKNLDHEDELMLEKKKRLLEQELSQMSDDGQPAGPSSAKKPRLGAGPAGKSRSEKSDRPGTSKSRPRSSSSSSTSTTSSSSGSESSDSTTSKASDGKDRAGVRGVKSARRPASKVDKPGAEANKRRKRDRINSRRGKGVRKRTKNRRGAAKDPRDQIDAKKRSKRMGEKPSGEKKPPPRRRTSRSLSPKHSNQIRPVHSDETKPTSQTAAPVKRGSQRDKFGFYRASPPPPPPSKQAVKKEDRKGSGSGSTARGGGSEKCNRPKKGPSKEVKRNKSVTPSKPARNSSPRSTSSSRRRSLSAERRDMSTTRRSKASPSPRDSSVRRSPGRNSLGRDRDYRGRDGGSEDSDMRRSARGAGDESKGFTSIRNKESHRSGFGSDSRRDRDRTSLDRAGSDNRRRIGERSRSPMDSRRSDIDWPRDRGSKERSRGLDSGGWPMHGERPISPSPRHQKQKVSKNSSERRRTPPPRHLSGGNSVKLETRGGDMGFDRGLRRTSPPYRAPSRSSRSKERHLLPPQAFETRDGSQEKSRERSPRVDKSLKSAGRQSLEQLERLEVNAGQQRLSSSPNLEQQVPPTETDSDSKRPSEEVKQDFNSMAAEFSDIGDSSDEELLIKNDAKSENEATVEENRPPSVSAGDIDGDGMEEGEAPSSRPESAAAPMSENDGLKCDESNKSKEELLEGISDSELDPVSDAEEDSKAKKTRFADALGVDWSQLCKMQKDVSTRPTYKKKWTPVGFFNKLGLPKHLLGDKYDEMVKKIEATSAEGEKLDILHPVPGIHCAIKSIREERRNLLSFTVGPYMRAISLREDIAVRRTLCNLPDEDFAPLITSNETELYSQAVENVPEKGQ